MAENRVIMLLMAKAQDEERISVRLEPELAKKLDAYRKGFDVPPRESDIVRKALREWLDRNSPPDDKRKR